MKQQPTIEQWDELDNDKKLYFWAKFLKDGESISAIDVKIEVPNIGQMIEFLGDDLRINNKSMKIGNKTAFVVQSESKSWTFEELADVLWMAVKEKLK